MSEDKTIPVPGYEIPKILTEGHPPRKYRKFADFAPLWDDARRELDKVIEARIARATKIKNDDFTIDYLDKMTDEAKDMTPEEYRALHERSRSMGDPDFTPPLEGVSDDIDQVEAVIRNYLLPAIKGTPALKVNRAALDELFKRLDPEPIRALLDTNVLVIEELMPEEDQEQLFDDAEVNDEPGN